MRRPSLPVADLFRAGWSRIRGGSRSGSGAGGYESSSSGRGSGGRVSVAPSRQAQMTRAARGHSPAVFKAIRKGGCHTGAQLRNQLAYLCNKSTGILDALGTYDGRRVLTAAEIRDVAERFEERWEAGRHLKLGHTSHLLMSFPIGTKPEHVASVARGICERFFQGEGAHFDYLVAIHTDRAHPHAHIVLNRQSPDGERFFLRSGHRFSYELFREAMVEHGERYGLRLEATRRLDRGVTTYAANTVAVQQAREAGHAVVERERAGADLARAQAQVAEASAIYRGLAEELGKTERAVLAAEEAQKLGEALLRASALLARGEQLKPHGGLYVDGMEARAEVVDLAGERVGAEAPVVTFQADLPDVHAAPGHRAKSERGSERIVEQEDGANLLRAFEVNVRRLEVRIAQASPQERPRMEQELYKVLASVSHLQPLGEESHTLHEPPDARGLYSAARLHGAELERLDAPEVRAGVEAALQGTGIAASEVLARLRAGAASAALETRWIGADLRAVAEAQGLDLGREADLDWAAARVEEVEARLEAGLVAGGVLRANLREHVAVQLDQEDETERGRPDARQVLRAALERKPARREEGLVAAVVERLRDEAPQAAAFVRPGEAQTFREALEQWLGPERASQLKRGDERALEGVVEDRLDRLVLTRAYLVAWEVPEAAPVHRQVLDELGDAQIDARRLRHSLTHGDEEGLTH